MWVCSFVEVLLFVINELRRRSDGRYVVVGGLTPTPFEQGKSTTIVGLCKILSIFQESMQN